MSEHAIHGLMAETMEKIRSMVDVDTIVGKPIVAADGTTLVPVSKVTFGFGSGGSDFVSRNRKEKDDAPLCFGGGGAAGVSITPVGFLIVKDGSVRMLPVNMPASTSVDRLIEMIPDAVNGVQNFVNNRRGGSAATEEPPVEDFTTTVDTEPTGE